MSVNVRILSLIPRPNDSTLPANETLLDGNLA
jgi:hypothetical protein